MSYGLLWIEGVVVSLLWVAAAAALSARIRSRGFAGLFLFFALAVLALVLGAPLAMSAVMHFGAHLAESWFGYCLSLFIAAFVGAVIILLRGRRRPAPGASRAAALWPAAWLWVALLGMILLDVMTFWNVDLAVRNDAANLRTEAGAMLLSVAPPQVEDERNAAVLYEKAFARIKRDPSLTSPDSLLAQDDLDPASPAVAQLLDRHAITLRLLRQASAMPACRFDHDFAHPSITMLLPELNYCRTAAQLLAVSAKHDAITGNTTQPINDLNALFRLARAAGSDPIIVCSLVEDAIDALGVKTLEAVLPHLSGADQLQRLQIGDVDAARRQAQRSLIGEEAFGLSIFSDLASDRLTMTGLIGEARPRGPNPDAANIPPLPMLLRIFVIPSDVQAYKQYLERCQQQVQEPFTPTTIEQTSEGATKAARHGLLTSIIVPALQRYVERVVMDEAFRATALAAIAVDRYRLDHDGAFPARLDALVPQYMDDVPLDPFDGHPLRFIVRNDQALIYSIGPDLKDDGGAPLDEQRKTGDMVFTVKSSPNAQAAPSTAPAQR
jgi:type II secretory pathway pseudopilin PulG